MAFAMAFSTHRSCYRWLVLKRQATLCRPAPILTLGLALALHLGLVDK